MKPHFLPVFVCCLLFASPWSLALGRPASAAAPPATEKADPDSDGDGLADFQEVHKYRTDPKKKDTAGQGVSDGD